MMYTQQHHQVYIQPENSQFCSLEMLPLLHTSQHYYMGMQLRLKKVLLKNINEITIIVGIKQITRVGDP